MARVFISHASADLVRAVEVFDWLRSDGHADAVVCIVTNAFVVSNWCAAEVEIADSGDHEAAVLAVASKAV